MWSRIARRHCSPWESRTVPRSSRGGCARPASTPRPLAPRARSPAIDAALRLARAELVSRLTVALDLPPRLVVRANRGSLTLALIEVFVRAAQAVRAAGVRRGNLHVRGREREGTAVVEIEDDIPVSAEPAARHLAPYLPSGMPAGAGGLGLAVARDLVDRQGGKLAARPRQGGGTVLELQMQTASLSDHG